MEMTPRSLVERMFLSLAQVNFKTVRGKPLSDFDAVKLQMLLQNSKQSIRIDGTPRLTPSEIRARARRDMREFRDLSLIVVDYVQMMRSDTRYDVRANEIANAVGPLRH